MPDENACRAFALVGLGLSMCPSVTSSQPRDKTFPESAQLAWVELETQTPVFLTPETESLPRLCSFVPATNVYCAPTVCPVRMLLGILQ